MYDNRLKRWRCYDDDDLFNQEQYQTEMKQLSLWGECSGDNSDPSRCLSKSKLRQGCENTGGGTRSVNGCCRTRLLPSYCRQQQAGVRARSSPWNDDDEARIRATALKDDGVPIKPEAISNRNEAIVALRGDDDCSGIRRIRYWLLKQYLWWCVRV